jgi:uncharacterized protein YkwD
MIRFAQATAVLFCLGLSAGPALANTAATKAINSVRAQQGLTNVAYSKALEAAARLHAQDMARTGKFSHKGSDGSNVAKRVRRQGYSWCLVAENIAMGQTSLKQVMREWVASKPHLKNMLLPKAREFAVVEGPGNRWVMVLAAPGC